MRTVIAEIVADTERNYSPERFWPVHPRDGAGGDEPQPTATCLYFGACGVIWALQYLQSVGAVQLSRRYDQCLDLLLVRNREWLKSGGLEQFASFMMGDTPILMMQYGQEPATARADALAALIESNRDNPTRELMWGAPGTLLAALFLHERTGEERWAAGPLAKGSNLCHGTGGNGYAFLNLYRRTGNPLWLERARAFAMHGIAQMQDDARQFGRLRYSLWTGDLGFALYLWNCMHGTAAFPTLDVFYG